MDKHFIYAYVVYEVLETPKTNIQEDLVYNIHSSRLIGLINLGQVNHQRPNWNLVIPIKYPLACST